MDQFYDQFVSLLTQLQLYESYALSIFTSNLMLEVSKYLQLFRPQTLVEELHIAR